MEGARARPRARQARGRRENLPAAARAPPRTRARARVRTEVVLSWQARPRDLDLHCVSSLGDHVYYANMTSRDRAVKLDIDVLDGYGPETLVIDSNGDRAFVVYVLNFSCEADIAQCQAKLSVVPGDGTSPFEIAEKPSAGVTGFPQFWKAFEIDAFGRRHPTRPAPARDGVLCVTEHDAQAPHFCPRRGQERQGRQVPARSGGAHEARGAGAPRGPATCQGGERRGRLRGPRRPRRHPPHPRSYPPPRPRPCHHSRPRRSRPRPESRVCLMLYDART